MPYLGRYTSHLTLDPAYGRDYKNAKAVKADWDAGKDFAIVWGHESRRYINLEDAQKTGMRVTIRYAKLTRVTTFTVARKSVEASS